MTSPAGAIVARLLASTVEVVADFELIYEQPAVLRAVSEAARALSMLSDERPEGLSEPLEALLAIVTALPTGHVDAGLDGWDR